MDYRDPAVLCAIAVIWAKFHGNTGMSMRCTSLPRFTFSFAALIVVLALASVPASSAVVANRISAQPSNENETGIPNSVHPHARAATDLGPAPSDTRLQGMTIRFSMTATQEAALDQLLDDLQNPSSPRYHQWLTPAEYGAQFGLSSADLGKVTAWLASQGFTVTDVAQSNNVITFDGTAAQVQAAFATSIHTVSYKGETHFANLTDAYVPTTTHVGGDPGPALSCTNCHPTVGDLAESSLDVEWSGAMAPSASILFVNGPDVFNNAMTGAVTQNLAPIITSSYGACEAGWGTTDLNTLNTIFKQANAQGQTILTSSGDQGAADCDAGSSAIEGLAADFPGSSPYVTSMGGTQVNDGTATGATTYWNSPDTTFTAGSAIPSADVSAKGYIPES